MSEETEVLVLSSAIEAPDGYTLDGLIAATYSLDLGVALGIPLGSIRNGQFAGMEAGDGSRWAVLEALRTLGSTYRVFCDVGGIGVPPSRLQRITQLLGEIVIPVAMPQSKGSREGRPSFHPKFLLARFKRKRGRPRLKLVCMSRNLSNDPSLDVSVVLDGVDTGRSRRAQGSHRFAAALTQLPQWVSRVHRTPETQALIDGMSRSVGRAEWAPPEGFDDVSLWPLGFGGDGDPMPLRSGEKSQLIMSPFLGSTRLSELRKSVNGESEGRRVLISSAEELEAVGGEALSGFEAYAFGGYEPDVAGDAAEGDAGPASPAIRSGLHAKLYVAERKGRRRVILGSANATLASVRRNAELMVECHGPAQKAKAFSIHGLLDPEGDVGRFLAQWEPAGKEAPAGRASRSPAEALMRELIACGASAEVFERGLDNFDLRVELDRPAELQVSQQAEIFARMSDSAAESFRPKASPAAILRRLTRRQLGAFLTLTVDLEGEQRERLLPLDVSGFDLRDLQTELIKGGGGDESVLAYIAFILDGAEEGPEVVIDFGEEGQPAVELGDEGSTGSSAVLEYGRPSLEKLVRLAYEARTSEDARQRMEDVGDAVKAYADELDDGFLAAWTAVEADSARE